jgi:hypothetical protein
MRADRTDVTAEDEADVRVSCECGRETTAAAEAEGVEIVKARTKRRLVHANRRRFRGRIRELRLEPRERCGIERAAGPRRRPRSVESDHANREGIDREANARLTRIAVRGGRQMRPHRVAIVVIAGDRDVRDLAGRHHAREALVLARPTEIREIARDDDAIRTRIELVQRRDRVREIAIGLDAEIRTSGADDVRVGQLGEEHAAFRRRRSRS